MIRLHERLLRVGGAVLFGAMLLTVWACDFEFDVQVGGRKIDVTATRGTADSIAARLRVGGKSCKAKRTINGIVGPDGCVTISGTICGQELNERLCGFQPGSEFQYEIEVDGGGMVVLQVPAAMSDVGSWRIENATGAVEPIEIADTPFGYVPAQPFVAEPGKRLLYARYAASFTDSLVDGDIVGALRQTMRGVDTVKFILAGLIRVRTMPGGPPVMALDSNFVFAERPRTYDFAAITGAPFAIPVEFVHLEGVFLTDAEARALGLAEVAARRYLAVTLAGTTTDRLSSTYRLSSLDDSLDGERAAVRAVGADTSILVAFDRTSFNRIVDSTATTADVRVRASLLGYPFPWTITMPITLSPSASAPLDGEGLGAALRCRVSPEGKILTVTFETERGGPFSLRLYDARGRLGRSRDDRARPGSNSVTLDLSGLPSGAYLVELRTGSGREVGRVRIVR